MPLSVVLIALWVLGIPAFVVYKAISARRLLQREGNGYRNAVETLPGSRSGVQSQADDRNHKLALTFISCGYLFQRYRLQFVWWEAVRLEQIEAPLVSVCLVGQVHGALCADTQCR